MVLYLLMIAALLRGVFPVGEASASINTESNVWTSIGPEGGSINTLAINPVTPTTLYAGTGGGVFKSTASPTLLALSILQL